MRTRPQAIHRPSWPDAFQSARPRVRTRRRAPWAAGRCRQFQSARPRVRTRRARIYRVVFVLLVSIRAPSGEDATRRPLFAGITERVSIRAPSGEDATVHVGECNAGMGVSIRAPSGEDATFCRPSSTVSLRGFQSARPRVRTRREGAMEAVENARFQSARPRVRTRLACSLR